MTHIMLDIETMGQGKRAAITQIGAVKFTPNGAPLPAEPEPQSPTALLINVDLQSSIDAGLEVDGSTIMWWLGQSTEARKSLFDPQPIPLIHALGQLKKFIAEWKTDLVWAKGPGFDCAIVSEAFRLTGSKFGAWSFPNERDVRTVIALAELDEKEFASETPDRLAHNALHDAWFQARMVQECYRRLGKSAVMI